MLSTLKDTSFSSSIQSQHENPHLPIPKNLWQQLSHLLSWYHSTLIWNLYKILCYKDEIIGCKYENISISTTGDSVIFSPCDFNYWWYMYILLRHTSCLWFTNFTCPFFMPQNLWNFGRLNHARDFGFFHFREAIQNVSGSSQVLVHIVWNNAESPEVSPPVNLESRPMSTTVLPWCKVNPSPPNPKKLESLNILNDSHVSLIKHLAQ
jgi:hypothetical protein